MNGDINFFAETTSRGQRRKFGIKLDDRRRHIYIIGKTGMGKSQMLQNMAIQDIEAGKGVGVIDPHGELAEAILNYVPSNRVNDVIYMNPADIEMPIGFNIMESVGLEQRHFIASGLMAAFKKIWVDVWSARMEYILNNALLALLEYPNATIMGANRMLSDKEYRKKVVENVQDPGVKSYWINEFAKYPERYREEAVGAIQNKIGQFISNPLIRNIVGQTKSTFNLRDIMDNKKILIINLSKGRIGEDNTSLLGTMLITKLQIAAMSRVDIPEEERNDFFMYVDEFQTFATPSFAGILSEARKYRLALTLAHQYITQMDEFVRDAVFGNAGTLIVFRIGAADAEFLESEFAPCFVPVDLVNLPKYNIAVKLMIDGLTCNAFSAITLPPAKPPEISNKDKIIRVSRERYGKDKIDIEDKISRWSGILKKDPDESREDSGESSSLSRESRLYDAVCSECSKNIKVTFEPDGVRPVYCKDCLAKKMREKALSVNQGFTPRRGGDKGAVEFTPRNLKTRDEPGPRDRGEMGDDRSRAGNRPSFQRAPSFKSRPSLIGAKSEDLSGEEDLKEITLNDAFERFPAPEIKRPEVMLAIQETRSDFGSKKRLSNDNLDETPVLPLRKRPRKEINLEGLRETLKDIIEENVKKRGDDQKHDNDNKHGIDDDRDAVSSPSGESDKDDGKLENTITKPKNSGIMEEGREIKF